MELEVTSDENNRILVVDKESDVRFKAKYGSSADGLATFTLFYEGKEVDVSVKTNTGKGLEVYRYINFPESLEAEKDDVLSALKACFLE